jgi:hypothetical protein
MAAVLMVVGSTLALLLASCSDSGDDGCDCESYCFTCDDPAAQQECGEDLHKTFNDCGCWDRWIASCLAASSEQECQTAHEQLPNPNLCTGGSDLAHACQWMEFHEVIEVMADSCTYGDARGVCAYESHGEEGCETEGFCGEPTNIAPRVSSFEEDGRVFVATSSCSPTALPGSSACYWPPPDYQLHGPAECECVCFDDFPGLD